MPTMTKHALGTFCWPECATTDAAGMLTFAVMQDPQGVMFAVMSTLMG